LKKESGQFLQIRGIAKPVAAHTLLPLSDTALVVVFWQA
jgi:hypothetical protein